MSLSVRKCKFCKEPGLSIERSVAVNPYYSYNIRSETCPIDLKDTAYIDIEEKFICPKCGQLNTNNYDLNLDQEDMKYLVNKRLEIEGK